MWSPKEWFQYLRQIRWSEKSIKPGCSSLAFFGFTVGFCSWFCICIYFVYELICVLSADDISPLLTCLVFFLPCRTESRGCQTDPGAAPKQDTCELKCTWESSHNTLTNYLSSCHAQGRKTQVRTRRTSLAERKVLPHVSWWFSACETCAISCYSIIQFSTVWPSSNCLSLFLWEMGGTASATMSDVWRLLATTSKQTHTSCFTCSVHHFGMECHSSSRPSAVLSQTSSHLKSTPRCVCVSCALPWGHKLPCHGGKCRDQKQMHCLTVTQPHPDSHSRACGWGGGAVWQTDYSSESRPCLLQLLICFHLYFNNCWNLKSSLHFHFQRWKN